MREHEREALSAHVKAWSECSVLTAAVERLCAAAGICATASRSGDWDSVVEVIAQAGVQLDAVSLLVGEERVQRRRQGYIDRLRHEDAQLAVPDLDCPE